MSKRKKQRVGAPGRQVRITKVVYRRPTDVEALANCLIEVVMQADPADIEAWAEAGRELRERLELDEPRADDQDDQPAA